MHNYLKKSLFIFFILTMPSMNLVSKAMNVDDEDPTSTKTIKVHHTSQPTIQGAQLRDDDLSIDSYKAKPSLLLTQSYDSNLVTRSFRALMSKGTDIIDFAISHPKISAIVVLSYVIPVAAAQPSYWCMEVCKDGSVHQSLGYPTNAICYNRCTLSECYGTGTCEPTTGGCAKTYCMLGK